MMRRRGRSGSGSVVLLVAICACGKKTDAPKPIDAAVVIDAAKPVDARPVDAPAPIDAAPVDAAPPPIATIDDTGHAKLKVARTYVPGEPLIDVALTLPKGWNQHDRAKLYFYPPNVKTDRPYVSVNVQIDNVDPSQVDAAVAKDLADKRTTVVGGGHVTKIRTSTHKDNHYLLSLEINAKAERSIEYVETTCYVVTPDQPFVVKMYGFAELKDAAYLRDFEAICPTVTVTP